MQSFDTKDSNTSESFDRKLESSDTFSTEDSEVDQSDNDFVESFDRKFEGFDTKDSEVKQSNIRVAESFDPKFEIADEEALPDSESFGTFSTKDSDVSIPNFDNSANSNGKEQSSDYVSLSDCASLGSQGPKKSKTDGRSKPRSQKQIEAYKRNFNARKPPELRIDVLDLRVRHLQSLVLSLLSGKGDEVLDGTLKRS